MRLVDLECPNCGEVGRDVPLKTYETYQCPSCGTGMAVTWRFTNTMNFGKPFSKSMNNATDNGRNSFGADDDPLCRQELFIDDTEGFDYTKLPKSERLGFLEKRMKDGDSPELRKEILDARDKYKGIPKHLRSND